MGPWTVELSSPETIKPSTQNLEHRRSYNLSWLDQFAPHPPVAIAYFYPPPSVADHHLPILKRAFSQTLSLYYPLAGRLAEDSLVIDCNDAGADFFVASVHATFSQVLAHCQTILDLPPQLLPSSCGHDGKVLAVQVNLFDCGGAAVVASISHRIADGLSVAMFVNAWAAVVRGDENCRSSPVFDSGILFPAAADKGISPPSPPVQSVKLVHRRYMIESSKMDELRKSYGGDAPPTRVEAAAALLWKCGMEAIKKGEQQLPKAWFAVIVANMRRKMEPPLPNSAFGNLCMHTAAIAWGEESREELQRKLQQAIKKVDKEQIKRLQGEDGHTRVHEPTLEAIMEYGGGFEGLDLFYFDSWFNFPTKEADFGWGKPVWLGTTKLGMKNFVLFLGPDEEGRMEVWVALEEKYVVEFERNEELLAFASPWLPDKSDGLLRAAVGEDGAVL